MIKLSAYLGFFPSGNYTRQTPFFDMQEGRFTTVIPLNNYLEEELSQLLGIFLKTSIEDAHQIKLSRQNRERLLTGLISYYRFHVEDLPEINAHKILKTVLDR